ncbi:hypothetical protein [Amycolatopsis sp. lyj-23]|uniref:hypothetical protein n=1 Tax=Amycolatopsis sp. lyj-23 TaxID=2789283 RepID=UPI00397AEDE3
MLSITEAFAADMLSREIDRTVATASDVAAKIADEAVIRATSTWLEQKKSYKAWLGVNENWNAVERLAEARNAVAHGLGSLTRRQLKNKEGVKAKLKDAGITVNDNKIVLSAESLAKVAATCREFIERLDRAVQDR